MQPLYLETRNSKETQKIAGFLAKELTKTSLRNQALVVALSGDLGGGKTTFVQGFAKSLGIREKILSPTFLILKTYKIPTPSGRDPDRKRRGYKHFTHIDAYRLESPKEILNLGWEKLIKNPRQIVVVEWAKNIKRILPPIHLDITFDFISLNVRRLTFDVKKK